MDLGDVQLKFLRGSAVRTPAAGEGPLKSLCATTPGTALPFTSTASPPPRWALPQRLQLVVAVAGFTLRTRPDTCNSSRSAGAPQESTVAPPAQLHALERGSRAAAGAGAPAPGGRSSPSWEAGRDGGAAAWMRQRPGATGCERLLVHVSVQAFLAHPGADQRGVHAQMQVSDAPVCSLLP